MAEQNSVSIPHADDGYEDLRIVLDGRGELKYAVNKAPVRKSISACGMQDSIKGKSGNRKENYDGR